MTSPGFQRGSRMRTALAPRDFPYALYHGNLDTWRLGGHLETGSERPGTGKWFLLCQCCELCEACRPDPDPEDRTLAGYELVPLDGGGRIPLPEGETLLGRGPLLGVHDKRVSRQHGVLENQNGRLRLKPIHVNPCFSLQAGQLDSPQPLERDRWHTLGHGELFSLMPGRFIYRVEALGEEHLTPRYSSCYFSSAPPLPHLHLLTSWS
ncbi:Aprataxin and PNK-like factor [Merluccius polli]|uniref:Aprataxin and PNK-like factor n=1 Tax=Merluccius polli TaxID=89951 RepID=A0AA47MZP8_MERPO|nr:Aprataxin and PNK-like factor [Merluccius polli]